MVKIEVFGGRREIGGNCIKINDGDYSLLFDQGIRFNIFKRYYGPLTEPWSIKELRDIGAVPEVSVYDGVSNIYISHLHLDHLGALGNIPNKQEIEAIYLPSIAIYQVMKKRWEHSLFHTWTSQILPERMYLKRRLSDLLDGSVKGDENVLPLMVFHSAYPSYAFLYFGSDETVLYTGDFTTESVLPEYLMQKLELYAKGNTLFEFLSDNPDIKVDVLIMEGTYVRPFLPFNLITYANERNVISNIRCSISGERLLFAYFDELNLELFLLLTYISSECHRKVLVYNRRLVSLLNAFLKVKPGLRSLFKDTLVLPDTFHDLIENNELFNYEACYEEIIEDLMRNKAEWLIITNKNLIEFIKWFRVQFTSVRGSELLFASAEPFYEELDRQPESTLRRWLNLFGIRMRKVGVLGHYNPVKLRNILEGIKPRKLLPVHTEHPELFKRVFRGKILLNM